MQPQSRRVTPVTHQKPVPSGTRTAPKRPLSRRIPQQRLLIGLFLAALLLLSMTLLGRGKGRKIALRQGTNHLLTAQSYGEAAADLPSGISGFLHSIRLLDGNGWGDGVAVENTIVGQGKKADQERIPYFNISSNMQSSIVEATGKAKLSSRNANLMSDYDYEVLCKIVEAEAGTEDLKGRILVANVIMNRVNSDEFPDTVSDVVFQYAGGVPQFSPVEDGRIYEVGISADTYKAVRQVLEGVDYSQGALFFIQKDAADPSSICWFEESLKFLFRHGVHEFYTYP